MKFNQGGNLLFIVDQKNVLIYNAYTLVKLHQIRGTSESVTDIVFGDRDSSFALITPDGFFGRYRMPSFQVVREREPGALIEAGTPPREDRGPVLAFKSCDFIPSLSGPGSGEGADESMFVTAGDTVTILNFKDQQKGLFIPALNMHQHHSSSQGFVEDAPPKYTQIRYIKTQSPPLGSKVKTVTGLIGGTDKGCLQIFAYPFAVEAPLTSPLLEQLSVHAGEVNKIVISPDQKFLFSVGSDGSLFIFSISEQQILFDKNGQLQTTHVDTEARIQEDSVVTVVDQALADIVLVKKQEMEEWRMKQEKLQFELNVNKRKVDLKLKETKAKYEKQYQEIERQKDLDISDLDRRYEDLKRQKELQDRQNMEAMRKMESNHVAAVDELAGVYERKLDVECGNFLKLEQEKLEMKKHYESRIAEIKRQNQKAIDKLLQEFKVNMVKVEGEYVDSKKTGKTVQDVYDK